MHDVFLRAWDAQGWWHANDDVRPADTCKWMTFHKTLRVCGRRKFLAELDRARQS